MEPTVFLLFALVAEWKTSWCVPVPIRIVDLTHIFDNTTLYGPLLKKFEINQIVVQVPNSELRATIEEFSSATHVGTHIDAPCHIGTNGFTVEDIPFEWLVAPAAVVDIQDKTSINNDYELQIEDLRQWENTTGYLLNQVILLVRSGWSQKWPNRTAFIGRPDNNVGQWHFPGISPSASRWLVANRNVYGVGVETMSLDHGPSQNFESHQILFEKNIYGLENMNNMEELPIFGATLYVMPLRIGGGACGAPCRIIATFPDVIYGL